MTRVALWEPEMSLPPRLLSADGAGIWKYQQHSRKKQYCKNARERSLGSRFAFHLVYRVYRADKFCQSGNNTIILKLPFEWCFMLCKPDFCINFSSSQFMNLHARVDYANLRKANFALVNRARFYISCWQFASSQMG